MESCQILSPVFKGSLIWKTGSDIPGTIKMLMHWISELSRLYREKTGMHVSVIFYDFKCNLNVDKYF